MQRIVVFKPGENGRFKMLLDGFKNGANMERQKNGEKGVSRQDRAEEMRIKRGLHSVSLPDGEPTEDPTGYDIDRRPRVLRPEGGEFRIGSLEFQRLQKYVGHTASVWLVDLVEQGAELEDWLDSCPKEEEGAAEASDRPRPELLEKRARK